MPLPTLLVPVATAAADKAAKKIRDGRDPDRPPSGNGKWIFLTIVFLVLAFAAGAFFLVKEIKQAACGAPVIGWICGDSIGADLGYKETLVTNTVVRVSLDTKKARLSAGEGEYTVKVEKSNKSDAALVGGVLNFGSSEQVKLIFSGLASPWIDARVLADQSVDLREERHPSGRIDKTLTYHLDPPTVTSREIVKIAKNGDKLEVKRGLAQKVGAFFSNKQVNTDALENAAKVKVARKALADPELTRASREGIREILEGLVRNFHPDYATARVVVEWNDPAAPASHAPPGV